MLVFVFLLWTTINALQIMHWMLCYFNLVFSFSPKTKLKNIIFYYNTNEITCVCKPFRKLYENLEKKFGEATYKKKSKAI